jgi:GNAT superfamily N-acetyltransferase
MDGRAVRDAFDAQVRRQEAGVSPGETVEREGGIVRVVGADWAGVTWSALDEDNADAMIAAQVRRFAERPDSWEWKYYSYDLPADLPRRLTAAGFVPDPVETLLFGQVDELAIDAPMPPGVAVRPVRDAASTRALLTLLADAFGDPAPRPGAEQALLAELTCEPSNIEALIATVGGVPVAGGRIEFYPGTEFAGMWGGGTRLEWRGQGIFSALVAHGAALASARGASYLQADAADTSRPILLRLGFVELAKTTPYRLRS